MHKKYVNFAKKIWFFSIFVVFGLGLLSACGRHETEKSSQPDSASQTPGTTMVPTTQPTETIPITYEPTYVVYNRALIATAIAIGDTIPTPSPRPDLHPNLQEDEKHQYIWNIAISTAVALFPPPPGYNPRAEMTPEITRVLPTEPPRPYTATENGQLYDMSAEDDPTANRIFTLNYWIGVIDQTGIAVFAGNVQHQPEQGVLLIRRPVEDEQTHERHSKIDKFITPTQSGALRIIGEVGGQMTLRADNGTYFYFDLNTDQWVSGSGTPSPSVTVTPQLSPIPSPSTQPISTTSPAP